MTPVLESAEFRGASAMPISWLGVPRLLCGVDRRDLVEYGQHFAEHGGLGSPSVAQLATLLDRVGLSGRGGAAFPLAIKLRSIAPGARPVVVVNGCEGEPASAKDTVLLSVAPHLVLDGAAVLAEATGAGSVIVAVTAAPVAATVRRALRSRPDAGRFEVRLLPERFISGEARALIAGLNGGPAVPPGRRTLPTEAGVNGAPTLLSNAETFAQLAVLVRIGPDEFARQGTAAEPGTTLLTVTGAVVRPGVLEVPHGVTLGQVAEVTGAVRSQAVVIGGFHGAWVAPDPAIVLSRQGLAAIGGTLGAGGVSFVGEQTCGLAELTRVAGWLASQSARQCGPCAFGLPALAADLADLQAGRARPEQAERHARMVTGRGACAHPDGASRFVLSGLRVLSAEVERHLAGGCGRADHGHLPLTRGHAFASSEVAR